MCYACKVCGNVSAHGQQQLRYLVYKAAPATARLAPVRVASARAGGYDDGDEESPRPVEVPTRRQIAQEVAVCRECYDVLSSGVSLKVLRRRVERGYRLLARALSSTG